MPARDDLRDGLAVVNDELRHEFLPGVEIALLKQSATADEFEEVLPITSKWFFEYSNYRKNFLLEIAEDSDDLTDAIQEATHVSVNDDIYTIDNGDLVAPTGTNPVWQIFCELFEKRGHYSEL